MRKLKNVNLIEFFDDAGSRPYRHLIQQHIRKQSTSKLQIACLGEIYHLPENLQPMMMDFIDVILLRFGYDKEFWMVTTCKQAFDSIINTAIECLPIKERIPSVQEAFETKNQELAFQLFQISTLSFAYSASTQKAQRRFMGIRKGLFG